MGAEPLKLKGVGWDLRFAELWGLHGRLLEPRDWRGLELGFGVTVENKLRGPMRGQPGRFW